MKALMTFLILAFSLPTQGQVIPLARRADWVGSGTNFLPLTTPSIILDSLAESGITRPSDDSLFSKAIDSLARGGTIRLGMGTYRITKTIDLPSNVSIEGMGPERTEILFLGEGSIIRVEGSALKRRTPITNESEKGNLQAKVKDTSRLQAGTWVMIHLKDDDLIKDKKERGNVAQLTRIGALKSKTVEFQSPLRFAITEDRQPYLHGVKPRSYIQIQNLKISRENPSSAPGSHILMRYATHCRVRNVWFNNADKNMVQLDMCSNIEVTGCYFQDSFSYGQPGLGNGVLIQRSTGESLVMDNIFDRLRHPVVLATGANGNAIAYNYMHMSHGDNPHGPLNTSDILIAGGYPFCNLIESNELSTITMMAGEGENGPGNTLFRNKLEGEGLIMEAGSQSSGQNFVANEFWTTDPFLKNFQITGEDHMNMANRKNGDLMGSGQDKITFASFLFIRRPRNLRAKHWPFFGNRNSAEESHIPAYTRYQEQDRFPDIPKREKKDKKDRG